MDRSLVFVNEETGDFELPRGDYSGNATSTNRQERHCCTDLAEQVRFRCTSHPALGSCADYLIGYHPTFDEYGLWIHDGETGEASSWGVISHCPFCGTSLPISRRAQWFDRLEADGLELDDAPPEMQRYGWWLA